MSTTQHIITICMLVLGTAATRFLPFLVFLPGKPVPRYVRYLGRVLPSAALALLVIYCFKDLSLLSGNRAAPELLAVLAVCTLHIWKRQMLLSIAGGTVVYMALVQLIFQ